MKKATFISGLIATLFAVVANAFTVEGATWPYFVVLILGSGIVYAAQHAIKKPITIFGQLDATDWIKGAIFAVGTSIISAASGYINALELSLLDLGQIALNTLLLYLGKNQVSNSQGQFLAPEKKLPS